MYVLKNAKANEGLETPINRQQYYDLSSELQSLYIFRSNRQSDDDDEYQDDDETTNLGLGVNAALAADNIIEDDAASGADINDDADAFKGFGGGSFGGGGAEADWTDQDEDAEPNDGTPEGINNNDPDGPVDDNNSNDEGNDESSQSSSDEEDPDEDN